MNQETIDKAVKGKSFVLDAIYDLGSAGKLPLGKALCALPGDQQMSLNYSSQVGNCTGLYYSLVFQLPKWKYTLKKLDEWMSVSPVHVQAYELTVSQKQKLEGTIKQGLASAAQAVADFELARHDLRKYEEIINYFEKSKKDKDEHILRSLFIDRVDAFTGENFSMISMTKRWPTIITDFIRLGILKKEDRTDIDKIKKGLQVSQAEGTILKTKNELFESWKTMFRPEVQERYARIKNLVRARERSVLEYREWLKPYVARYKMMNDSLERNPSGSVTDVYMAPAFGNAVAASSIRFVAWIPFAPPEMSKPERVSASNPVDDFAMQWAKAIANHHKVWGKYDKEMNYKIDGKKLEKRVKEIWQKAKKKGEISDSSMYYRVFDITAMKFLGKIPGKGEVEDITFSIKHRTVSHNVLLLHAVELEALEEKFDKNLNELIGTKEYEDEIREEVMARLNDAEVKSKKMRAVLESAFSKIKTGIEKPFYKIKSFFAIVTSPFIRPGPYESNFEERLTKMYFLPAGQLYAEIIKFLKWKVGLPKTGPTY